MGLAAVGNAVVERERCNGRFASGPDPERASYDPGNGFFC
jgi:hypothetical protein